MELLDRAARTVADPDRLVQTLGPTRAATLHDGLAGTALVLAVLSDSDTALAQATVRHWDAAARLLKDSSPDGIYRGPGALATSLILGNAYLPSGARRTAEAERATRWLSARACGLGRHQDERLRQGPQGTPWAVYDTMRGLAGIGRILLAATATEHATAAEPGLHAALTTLTGMVNTPTTSHPGWWVPHDERPSRAAATPSPGAATTGLAHGIAGPLTFLSLAHKRGHAVPGQTEAIHAAAAWLLSTRTNTGTWPSHVQDGGQHGHTVPDTAATPSRRDAWCYGNAGIGNALIHAGEATLDPTLTSEGHAALDVIARRPTTQWDTTGAGICHGTAGVLLTARTHHHTNLRRKAENATHAQLPATDPTDRSDPGLLTGLTGSALALSSLDHQRSQDPWTAALLLT